MSVESFDNINQAELQASIEAELLLLGNANSGPIYMEMETFSGSLPQQQAYTPENTPNLAFFNFSIYSS